MRNEFKVDVLMFKEIRERFESFRVRNITFFFAAIERECVNFLYMEIEF